MLSLYTELVECRPLWALPDRDADPYVMVYRYQQVLTSIYFTLTGDQRDQCSMEQGGYTRGGYVYYTWDT